MSNPLKRLFKYSDTVSIEISGDVSGAIERLSHSASKLILQAAFSSDAAKPSLVGNVSKTHVRLHKVTPLLGNIFKPFFVGKFESQNGRYSLVGAFEMGPLGRIVISIFTFFTLAIQLVLLPGLATEPGSAFLGLFQPTLFLCGGLLLILIFKAYSKRDIAWIRDQIKDALSN